MRPLFDRRPSPALVVSTIALFMALGGGAVAATSASDNAQDHKIASGVVKKNTLWAVVSPAGSIMSGRNVTSADQPFGTGTYEVIFNRNVRACSYTVTERFPGGATMAEPRSHNKKGVYVQTYDPSGLKSDNTFSLQVEC
jgi:hypothetical protein